MQIGWIGLGAMGLGMARCAARAGHRICGHTRGRPEHEALIADGGRLSRDLHEAIAGAEAVCINVFDTSQLHEVLYTQGVLAAIPPGAALVVHTTSSPAFSRQLQADAPAGVIIVDAAFSGSPQQAAAGQLTMMVGGTTAGFARVEPLLQTYAGYLRHVGGLGAGMQLKLLNNVLFAAHVHLAATTYRLASRDGFDIQTVMDVLTRGSAASRGLEIVGGRGTFEENLGRLRKYLEKDVAVACAAAHDAGMDLGILAALAKAELAAR